MSEPELAVTGIGNAIVDVLSHADDRFLRDRSMVKGTMALIDAERGESLYRELGDVLERSGGSAANTMVGIANLGGKSRFIGKVKDDSLGSVFRDDIRRAGVRFDTSEAGSGPGTGRCVVLVTPDGERTMQTYLGASAHLGPEDVDEAAIAGAAVTYLEGYLWDPPPAKEAFLAAARIAHEAGRKVALSLSDPFCVDRHREEFQDLVVHHVDILFGNEDEVVSLYRASDFDDAVRRMTGRCEIAALTRGSRGAVIVTGGVRHDVPAAPVQKVVDTTGAGDLFAAGFLYGLTSGRGPAEAGRIGAIAAAEVIGHFGARPETDLARRIREG